MQVPARERRLLAQPDGAEQARRVLVVTKRPQRLRHGRQLVLDLIERSAEVSLTQRQLEQLRPEQEELVLVLSAEAATHQAANALAAHQLHKSNTSECSRSYTCTCQRTIQNVY